MPDAFQKRNIPLFLGSAPFLGAGLASDEPYAHCCAHHLAAQRFVLRHTIPPPAQPDRYPGRAIGQLLCSWKGTRLNKSLNASLLTPVPAKSTNRNYQPLLVLPSVLFHCHYRPFSGLENIEGKSIRNEKRLGHVLWGCDRQKRLIDLPLSCRFTTHLNWRLFVKASSSNT